MDICTFKTFALTMKNLLLGKSPSLTIGRTNLHSNYPISLHNLALCRVYTVFKFYRLFCI